jgi:hypothetical protein
MAGVGKIVLVGASVFGVSAFVACGGSDPEPENQYQAGTYPSASAGYPAAQPPAGQPYPAAQPYPSAQPAPAPVATAPAPAASVPAIIPTATPGAPAQQLDASAGAAAQPILNQLATTEAPGAKPVGAAVVGMFQPGQQLETTMQMAPGKCYSVVAAGLPPITEVNVQLVAAMPIPGAAGPVLAEDQTVGSNAVLGKAPNCFKWPLPMPASVRVVTTVAAGQGIAAMQVYEK